MVSGVFSVVISFVWSSLSWGTRKFVELGWRTPAVLDARVISVGNLQAGGAGKTPLVALIAREGIEKGLTVCILTRGYRSAWESSGGLLPPEHRVETSLCGDEAALLRDLVPQAWIAIGADRREQFEKAKRLAEASFDLVVLDDGFQNRRIKKDVEVVAVTSRDWSEAPHREFRSALRYADLVVWTKGATEPGFEGRPSVRVRYRLPEAGDCAPLCLVTGVANGREVAESARMAGYRVAEHLEFRDHASYEKARIDSILTGARSNGRRVAVTGKDWVKWRELGVEERDVLILEPELFFENGRETWNRVLWGV